MRHKMGSPYLPLISAGVSEPVRDPAILPGMPGGRVPKHHAEFAFWAAIKGWKRLSGLTWPIDKQ